MSPNFPALLIKKEELEKGLVKAFFLIGEWQESMGFRELGRSFLRT
jgi:hypothetical protein